jgi:hypothetical protein
MKRNNMVAIMALDIARQAIESGNSDVDLSWLSVSDLLDRIEEAGMVPPPHLLSFFGVTDNSWEEEK